MKIVFQFVIVAFCWLSMKVFYWSMIVFLLAIDVGFLTLEKVVLFVVLLKSTLKRASLVRV